MSTPRSVHFSPDTNQFDSPVKAFNFGSDHTNTAHSLADKRGELRFNMHGKVTVVDYSEFINHFLPSFNTPQEKCENVFKEGATPAVESNMYSYLVSGSLVL